MDDHQNLNLTNTFACLAFVVSGDPLGASFEATLKRTAQVLQHEIPTLNVQVFDMDDEQGERLCSKYHIDVPPSMMMFRYSEAPLVFRRPGRVDSSVFAGVMGESEMVDMIRYAHGMSEDDNVVVCSS